MDLNDDISGSSFVDRLVGFPVQTNPNCFRALALKLLLVELKNAILLLSDEEVAESYMKNRFYLLNKTFPHVELAFRPALSEEEAEVEMDSMFPKADWFRWGPAKYFIDEHPIGADGMFLAEWRPDADEFRMCLFFEAKAAAMGISHDILRDRNGGI